MTSTTQEPVILETTEEHAGFRTRVLSVEGEGPAFVLIHGFSDSADTWRRLLRRLGRRGRRAVAFDMPSHGRASSLKGDRPALEQLVDCAESVARQLGDDTVVVGNSLGGTVALLLAERGTVGHVIPVGPGAFEHPFWLRWTLSPKLLQVTALLPPFAHRSGYYTLGLVAGMPPRFLNTYWSHVSGYSSQARLRKLAGWLDREAREPYQLAQITCPVTLVWGDRDRFSLPVGSKHLVDAIPHLRYEVMRGVGHTPQQQVPDRLADLLCDVAPAD